MKRTLSWRFVLSGGLLPASLFFHAATASAQDPVTGAAKAEPAKNAATNAVTHTLAAKDAAAAWNELSVASLPPTPPDEWQLKEPTQEEKARFFLPFALVIADKSKDFYSRFPDDTNALTAKLREYGILSYALENGLTNQQDRFDASEKAILADPKLPEDDRFGLRNHAVEKAVHDKESEGDAAMLAEFEKGARMLQKEFPKRPEIAAMLLQVAENSEPEKSRALLKEIAASDAPADLKEAGADMQKDLDRVGKPLALKFAAVDGRAVDSAKMPGKAVLLVFWAAEDRESVGMIEDDVKAAYEKFHAKGLEIAGVNMDEDKESMTNFVAAQQIEWPQYFDGLGPKTKLAVEFGVKDPPALWLADKKGVLRYINAGFDLNKKIEALLGE